MATSQRRDQPLTIGTAGHIDHGKTALINALTGKNTDRLPEERSRGISIELGYAPLTLPSGRHLSVVDVPGHERFVRTMVAGASGIDLFLMCVAADDGVMPQTREHLAVLRQLGVSAGVVAVTKADIGEPELAAEEASELLPGIEVVPVSALAGTGLDELLAALDRAAEGLHGRADADGPVRLHLDRSFTLKGIGTVVTGTLWSGSIGQGDSVRVLPLGLDARVRSVQVHDQPVERAAAGQRVALNLVGVGWRELGRGDVVSSADGDELAPTYLIDAALSLEPGARPLPRGKRVHVHHGTREAPARVVPLEGEELRPGAPRYAQLRLEAPLVPLPGDRVIVRQLAPPDTVGGGVVIDAHPRKHGPSAEVVERLRALERGEQPPRPEPEQAPEPDLQPEPLDEVALQMAALLRSDGQEPRTDNELAEAVELSTGDADRRLRRLVQAGQAVRVGRNLHFHPEPLAELVARVVALCERQGSVTIASVRDELGTSRKYAQALLEHLDGEKVTRRVGDAHMLRAR
jgi:selenocysteine-specific elongation factor